MGEIILYYKIMVGYGVIRMLNFIGFDFQGSASSRFYQNLLQVFARFSTVFLFLSGSFFKLDKSNLFISLMFLLFNMISGYLVSHLRYRRQKVVLEEFSSGKRITLSHSMCYQKHIQIFSRGREIFVFILGLLLGQGYLRISLIILAIMLVNGFFVSELIYKREQAILRD